MTVVIEALRNVTKEFYGWVEKLQKTNIVGVTQKTALLGTARILRKVLEMKRRDHSVNLWPFVVTRLIEQMTTMATART